MNIPNEAVEAAARSIVRTVIGRSWDSLLPSRQDWYRTQTRAALTAALPHLPTHNDKGGGALRLDALDRQALR